MDFLQTLWRVQCVVQEQSHSLLHRPHILRLPNHAGHTRIDTLSVVLHDCEEAIVWCLRCLLEQHIALLKTLPLLPQICDLNLQPLNLAQLRLIPTVVGTPHVCSRGCSNFEDRIALHPLHVILYICITSQQHRIGRVRTIWGTVAPIHLEVWEVLPQHCSKVMICSSIQLIQGVERFVQLNLNSVAHIEVEPVLHPASAGSALSKIAAPSQHSGVQVQPGIRC
mmetsp:Transcript_7424/g.16349  ORF Transcript_7424/g.16349 Transcript_7424/m.16349 type:complete len:224 (+) Transcript_7424:3108-3779(+)